MDRAEILGKLTAAAIVFSLYAVFGWRGIAVGVLITLVFYSFFSGEGRPRRH